MKFSKTTPFVALSWLLLSVVTGCSGPEAAKAKYMSRAEGFMADENWPKARVALRNVLKIDPKDTKGYFLRARVAEKEKDYRTAFINYRKTADLDPDHREALIRLAWFYLGGNALDEVEEVAGKILARYPDDVMAETFRAAVLAREDRISEAVAKAEALIRKHPKQAEVAGLLAALYSRQEHPAKAERVLTEALKAHPEDIPLLNDLGITYHKLGKSDQAEEAFHKIIEIEPDVFEHHIRLVRFYISSQQPGKAETVLRDAIREEPTSEIKRLALAEFLSIQKDAKEGEALLLEARRALPASHRIRFALGQLYETSKRFSEARAVYEEIVKEKKSRQAVLSARVRLAALDWEDGETDAAEANLKRVLKDNPRSSEALILKGRMALAGGEGQAAVQAFRTALRDQPELIGVHILLGQAHLALGERALARERLEKAVYLNRRHVNARRFLARLDLAEGARQKARDRVKGILKDVPQDLEALGLLLTLQVLDRAWPEARETLAQMREAGVDPFKVDVAEGDLYQASKAWGKAVTAYERAARLQPDALEPLRGLVQVSLQQGAKDEAIGRLRRIISKNPKHPYAHGLFGELLLSQDDHAGAEKELEVASRINPEWFAPWSHLVKLKFAQKKPSEAEAALERGLQANPASVELRMLLASMLEQTDQFDRAIEAYETVLKRNPRMSMAANNLAFLLADRKGDPKSLEKALALSQGFEKRYPNPLYLDTLGWVYVKLGQEELGLRLLKEVVNKVPDQPLFDFHLGMAYYGTGEKGQARVYLAKAVKSGIPFSGFEEAQSVLKEVSDE